MYRIGLAGALALVCCGLAAADVKLNAAVVPTVRAVEQGETVTVFSTVINSGDEDAVNCRVEARETNSHGTDLDYQRTDAANQPIGTPNTPFSIPAGGSQPLVLAIRPDGASPQAWYGLHWRCDGAETNSILGVSMPRIRLVESGETTADVIMSLVTLSGDGIIRMADNGRRGVAAGSAVNIGDPGPVDFTVNYPGFDGNYFPWESHLRDMLICFTDQSGQCLAPPARTISDPDFQPGEIHTFTVFLDDQAGTIIPLMPDHIRLHVQAAPSDATHRDVGGTSVAVTDGTALTPVEGLPALTYWYYVYNEPGVSNAIGRRIRITEDGYFYSTGYTRNPSPIYDFVFGRVDVQRDGDNVRLTGSPTIFTNGQATGPLDLSTLSLTLGGRVGGSLPQLEHNRIRGFYGLGEDDPIMNPAADPNGEGFVQWEAAALDRPVLSYGTLTREAGTFELSSFGLYFNDGSGNSVRCETNFDLQPNMNAQNRATGSYSVTATVSCNNAIPEYEGSYTGGAVVEATGYGGACLILAVLTNQTNGRVVPFGIQRRDAPFCGSDI